MDATGGTIHGDADTAAAVTVVPATAPRRRRRAHMHADAVYHAVSLVVSLLLIATLVGIVGLLAGTAWPAFGRLGFGFFTGTVWNMATNVYGAVPFVAGTLITTALALLIAVPISLLIAILLTEYAPRPARATLGVVIDVAAGVPTIVFGAWALLALIPWLHQTGEPAIFAVLGWLPIFSNPNHNLSGFDVFAAGLVLAAMVFPTIVTLTRNSFLLTPVEMRAASLALGATRWETATRVVLRQGRAGLLGAIVLACGRALGETMAVAYVIGTVPYLPRSLFDQGATISTELLTQVSGGAAIPGTLYTAALYELGLILLVLSLLTSLGGRLLTRRLIGVAAVAGGGR